MIPNPVLAAMVGVLFATGVYLLLSRSISRALLGVLLMANGANVLFLMAAGPAGRAPISTLNDAAEMSDPLPQAMVLTAIVITLGMTAFILAMAHRSWQLARSDVVEDDLEDLRLVELADRDDVTNREPDGDDEDDDDDHEGNEGNEGNEDDEDDEDDDEGGHGRDGAGESVAGTASAAGSGAVTGVTWTTLVPLPVVVPLVAAGITVAVARRTRLQRAVTVAALVAVLVVSAALLVGADRQGPLVVETGGWPARMGIVLVVDRLSALMLVVSSVVTLAVLLYSVGQDRDGGEASETDEGSPLPVFHPTMLVLSAGVSNTFVTGDLFNLYVGFEMLLAASFVLLTLGGTVQRVRAGISYVVVSLLASTLFLSAIALVYAATGTVNLAQLAGRLDDLPAGTRLSLQLMLLLGFAVKAAVFPMFGWLPDSYPTAPAPVTAVFAGLLTKVGVYAVLRTQTLLFPDGRLQSLLMWAALATMVVGILGAVAQEDIKRMLSFTLVSHIGYMIFGVAVGSVTGLSAAIFYVAHHITIQTTLFLVAGLVERLGGTTSLGELGGLAKVAPVLGLLFFVPAMNLAGIPPLSGFLGKLGLLQAGAQQGTWLAYVLVGASVVTSLLTLYAVSRVWSRAFWQVPSEPVRAGQGPLPLAMVTPTAALVIVGAALTLVAGPLFGFTDRAAADMLDRRPYIEAVFPGGVP